MRALIAVALMLCSACSALVASSPDAANEATTSPRETSLAAPPSASPSPFATETPPSATPAGAGEFKFIRWTGGYKILASEPGGPVSASQDVHVDQIAGVLDSVQVDGVEWIRVQYGSDRPGDWPNHGWAPAEADIDRGGGIHVDRVYDYVVPDCPDVPTLADLGGMTPLQAVYCFGSRTLTFAPVLIRHEVSELDYFVDGSPPWLAIAEFIANWLPDYEERGATSVYVDPASGVELPEQTWLELTGQLDYRDARNCSMTSTEPEALDVANRDEAVTLCRGHLVVTGVRQLTEAEIPISGRLVPGPEPSSRVDVAVRQEEGPVSTRYSSSSIWTGTKLLVWGGWDASEDQGAPTNDGFTYTPATKEWGTIPRAPVAARALAVSSWTGSELLVWGGQRDDESPLSDGAAYNPSTGAWRMLASGPLRGSDHAGSTWTGTDWWIAAENESGGVDVAAYDPATDSWRTLPTVPDIYADPPTIVWTGSEILLFTAAGLFRMPAGGSDWIAELHSTEWHGPGIWTGDLFIALASSPIGSDPLDSDYLTYAVAWDPKTRSTVELALPPRNVSEPVLAGSHLAFFDDGLALDLTANAWVAFDLDEKARNALQLVGHTSVWAADRLLVWGGLDACVDKPPKHGRMLELMPQWNAAELSASSTSARHLAVRSRSETSDAWSHAGSRWFAC